MRKDTLKKDTQKETRRISSYHAGGMTREDYAFAGWKHNKYFTSDRYITLDEMFNRPDGKPLKGFGIEFEFESFAITGENIVVEVFDKVIASLFPDDMFKYQRDASLRHNASAEAITQVMTKEFIRNHYPEFKFMFDTYFPALGFSASETGNCGMHVNISVGNFGTSEATQELAVKKMFYIINKHFTFFCDALKRDRRKTGYCGQMVYQGAKSMNLHRQACSHGVCFNMGHYDAGRVEIRLAGGQAKFATFRNTMEVIFHLIDAVKRISWDDCDKLTAIFAGCNRHVIDRLKDCYNMGSLTEAEFETIKASATDERYI